MIKGTTKTGFDFSLDEVMLADYEVLELICEVDSGNSVVVPKLVEAILGKEQKENLKKHVRNMNGGKCPVQAMSDEITNIMTATKELKN